MQLISGDAVGALAMSEAGSGSDVVSMRCKAEKKGKLLMTTKAVFWPTFGGFSPDFGGLLNI